MEKSENFNIETVVEKFFERAELFKTSTKTLLDLISQGRIPTKEQHEAFNKEFNEIEKCYKNIFNKAREINPDVNEDLSIEELRQIIKKHDNTLNKIDEAKKILKQFIQVKSYIEKYTKALEPYQEEAKKLIQEINNQNCEELLTSNPYRRAKYFIEALNNPDNDEAFDVIDEIYPKEVAKEVERGLLRNKYFLADTNSSELKISTENEQSKPAQEPDAEPEQAQTEEPNAIDETPADNTTAEEIDSALTSNQPTINEAKSENNQQPIILTSENKIRKKDKPGSKFVKELRNKKTQNLSHMLILSLLTYFGALTDIQAKKFSDIFQFSFDFFKLPIPLKLIQIAFSDLTKKDNACLISTFILTTTKERVYCLTKYTLDGFNSNPIKNLKKEFGAALQDMPLGNSKFFTDETIEEEILIDQKEKNDSLLDLLERIKDQDYLKSILSDKDFAQNPYYLLENSNETFFSPTVETTKQHEISEPEPNKPGVEQTSAIEEPKQVEPVQIEPIKSEEEIPAKQDETEPKKQAEPAEQTESESPVSEIPQPEDSIKEENIEEEESTVEDSPKEKEISNADTATQETEPEQTENRDDALTTICNLIKSDKIYCATAYAKAKVATEPYYEKIYNALAYAVDDPMAKCDYISTNIQKLNEITEEREFIEPLIVSAAIRTFFSGRNTYDYTLQSLHDTIRGFETVDSNSNLKETISNLFKFKESHHKGLDFYVSQNNPSLEKEIKQLKQDAADFINLTSNFKERIDHTRFKKTKRLIFEPNGKFIKFLNLIKDGNIEKDTQHNISEFVKKNFIKEGRSISQAYIDDEKIWEYIKQFWDKAADKMSMKQHDDLRGSLRNNIIGDTKKCVTLLIDWFLLIEKMPNESDTGINEYNRSKKSFISSLQQTAQKDIKDCLDRYKNDMKKYAGLKIVEYTVYEIKKCIDNNNYIENEKKYFYADFLKTPYILLDNNYLPVLKRFHSDPSYLLPENRILQHANNVDSSSFEKRLNNILEESGDDYGSFRLINEYLKNKEQELEYTDSIIKDGKDFAEENVKDKKEDFVGELELAYAYGQIDISEGDKKDEILTNINEWFKYTSETENYGFFRMVLASYLKDIKEKAKSIGEERCKQLEEFESTKNDNLSMESKKKILAKIKEMIDKQIYTVAEELLMPPYETELSYDVSEKNYLNDFIENYNEYYNPASKQGNFFSIISSSIKSDEAKAMARNWFSERGNIGENKLNNLFTHLGFGKITIETQQPIKIGSSEYENYIIMKTKSYSNIIHPIAALGSGMRNGVRVVCICENKNGEQLVNTIKQLGIDKRHSIILLDSAINLPDRRLLAKKSKILLGDKLFAVIDRTVMTYMLKKYDNSNMNPMLMALIMPFTYYQPYVYKSADPMPPEMFKGRKTQLEKIKSPTGVNIVYGGRQLGKSALLKKAKDDINKNGNENEIAVFIDIKDCDCKETAKKIFETLCDEKILKKDIEISDNWNDLARAVKKRLKSDHPTKISYLLLLLDEADTFISSCKDIKYAPFNALKDIQQNADPGQFKFVIAGLRNIVKFDKERAIGDNAVLPHLESMTVTPFNPSEARELLAIPLHYLGLRFPKDKEYLIYLILATTNYFPGLIQMYCAKLLEAMHKDDYAGYSEADTPAYEISENHIKKVLSDPDFIDQIREKYEITLGLTDKDNKYYYIIALAIAWLHHNKKNISGYSPEDVKDFCKDWGFDKITNMKTQELTVLLNELKELNILRNTGENRYWFARYNFFQLMGTKEKVDDKIFELLGQE